MIKLTPDPIEINSSDMGKAFAEADDCDQADFLMALVDGISYGKWAMQCAYIAKSLELQQNYHGRKDIVSYLECLIEHINEYQN